jgi:hypothetical protein
MVVESPPNQRTANQSHCRRFSVSAFMGGFAPEQIVAVGGVGKHHRQHDGGTDEQKRLGRPCRCCLSKGDAKGNQPRPQAYNQPNVAHEKDQEAQEEWAILDGTAQIAPDEYEEDYGYQGHGQKIEKRGHTKPEVLNVRIHHRHADADN